MSVSVAPQQGSSRISYVRELLNRPGANFQMIVGATLLLLFFGLVMVLSASSIYSYSNYGNAWTIFSKQAIFAAAGLFVFWFAIRLPLELIRAVAIPALVVSAGLIAITFTPLGLDIRGNRNWIPLVGGFNLQPSEFAKLGLVLWIAWVYARQLDIAGPRGNLDVKRIFLPMLPVSTVVIALVIAQKDLGTAAILMAITVGMLFLAGLPVKHLAVAVMALAVPVIGFIWSAPHRLERFLIFLNPEADPENTGYQVLKGMMGFARGGFWGLGVGNSRQKWGSLPDAHTDFIFAIVGEELGLAGGLVLLGLFVLLIGVGFRVAEQSRDNFTRFLAAGICTWLVIQASVNIAMVLGTIPVIGVPLPLISYGGSSLIATLAALGLLANCARNSKPHSRPGPHARGRKA